MGSKVTPPNIAEPTVPKDDMMNLEQGADKLDIGDGK